MISLEKSTTPERFERLVTGFGHERKEFDEMHEKVFEENEQLRKALVKIYSRVKEAMTLAANPTIDQSQLEQHPIGDEEMELEEGLAATEQVILLLDQIISQGKQNLDENGLSNPFNMTREALSDENPDETFTGYGKKTRLIN